MALDHTHPGGKALAERYKEIMRGHGLPQAGIMAAPGRTTSWQQVVQVLDNMWWDYEAFVYSCNDAFKIKRVQDEPRDLELRMRCGIRRWAHRGVGDPAAAAVHELRDSLVEAESTLRTRCYVAGTVLQHSHAHPPTAPAVAAINPNSLATTDINNVGDSLQNFRDKLDIAVKQVDGYVRILEKDAQRRQAWFDNAIKLLSVVTGLGSMLAPI